LSNKILVVCSDTHCGRTVGLCPPHVPLDDGGHYDANPAQMWLWDVWRLFWREVEAQADALAAPVTLALNGDILDNNKHDAHQQITVNLADLVNIAEAALRPALRVASRVFAIRGTEAHSGPARELEEILGRRIGAETTASGRYSRDMLQLDWGEKARFLIAHAPGTNSMRPWTKGNAANRAGAMVTYNYFGQARHPTHAVFGHVHHYEHSDAHPVEAWFTPPWKLGDNYDAGSGRVYQKCVVGGMWFLVRDGVVTDWTMRRFTQKSEEQEWIS